ncbi:hypothetical protein HAALTHF_30180n [Vreelandella aquamarina]|nr:hypothetical protein HAALTHF_30180n [Halomonas axialensis]
MRLIQITDSHLYADKQARSRAGIPWQQFQRVLEAVITERPDVVVFTGDISQDETAASYAPCLRGAFGAAMPVVLDCWQP